VTVHWPGQQAKAGVENAVRSAGRKYGASHNASGSEGLVIILLS
jgi:hypothetical protein